MRRPPSGPRGPSLGRGMARLGGSRLTKAVAYLIGLEVGVFLVYIFSSKATQAAMVEWLVLTPNSLLQGHVWKLVTATIMNVSGMSFFFNTLMLWLFVPVLESWW